ncbi:hypothetical protein [Phaeobacter sp. CAU 1743]|uniref:hypothetical protein n=1 Tax=Phaeobacter sp. CAU 1743 TaxID=3140367 RepID=UPI00325B70B9
MIKGVLEEGFRNLEGEEVQVLPQAVNYVHRDEDGTVLLGLGNGHVVRTRLNMNSVIEMLSA